MAEISQIRLPSGTIYDIKDAVARETVAGGVMFRGVTTTEITDGAATTSYVVGSNTLTAANGDLVVYGTKEFLYSTTDNKWHEMGDNSAFKALAYKDTATATYTPAGTVSQPTFNGTEVDVDISVATNENGNYTPAGTVSQPTFTGDATTSTGKFTPAGNVSVSASSTTNKTAAVSTAAGTATYTPGGTVDAPVFTGTQATINGTGTFQPAGSVSLTNSNKTAAVTTGSGTATYTPAGSVAAPTFTGEQATIESSATYTPAGSVSFTNTNQTAAVSPTTGTATYTPAGSVAAPEITVANAGATTTIKNPTSQEVAKTVIAAAPGAAAPANSLVYYNVAGEVLSLYQLGYTTGDSITTSNVTVKTGDAEYEATAPSFTGTGVRLVTGNISVPSSATFRGTEATIESTAEYQPVGSNSAPAFTGTGVHLVTENIAVPTSATFTGTEDNISTTATYTPAGSNSAPDFTGTGVRLVTENIAVPSAFEATFTGTEGNVSVTGTPTGTVSQPTFSGTKVEISGTTTAEGTVTQPTFTGTEATITVS